MVKELNGHAGRLATLLGLVVAATALSLGNGPLNTALTHFDLPTNALVYGSLVLAGVCVRQRLLGADRDWQGVTSQAVKGST
jgi:hypothetical protein